MGFSFRDLIRAEIDAAETVDPRVILERAAREVPIEHLLDALLEAGAPYVKTVLFQDRLNLRRASRPRGSNKWDAISAVARKFLQESHYVPTLDKWQPLGLCSLGDVQSMADLREAKGRQVLAEAERYRRLCKAMVRSRVSTVADLPEIIILEVFLEGRDTEGAA
jgi:hypothetical protein